MRSALAFLTTLPVGGYHAEIRRGTLIAFPFAGMVLGLSWWAAAMVGARVWGPVIAASIVLVVDLGVTGGLHLDGLADVADGVGSQRRGDALREVLGDPRIGAIGAATLATALLLRFAAILSPGGLVDVPVDVAVAADERPRVAGGEVGRVGSRPPVAPVAPGRPGGFA